LFNVIEYIDENGVNHFKEWLVSLDTKMMARIQARIFRFQLENLGDVKPVGEGVLEARFHFGAGYRLYFGQDGGPIVVLLIGGDKSTQTKDIEKAKVFWKDFKESKNV
jgi:putative addiction module killer protein